MSASRGDRRPRAGVAAVTVALALLAATDAHAKPFAPDVFCETYADQPTCQNTRPDCALCHVSATVPPVMNVYGADVADALAQYVAPPFIGKDVEFGQFLPMALADVEALDSDGDGFANVEEIRGGTLPGLESSVPGEAICPTSEQLESLDYRICSYDYLYVYRKIGIDFCGLPPTFEEVEAFVELSEPGKQQALHELLDACLDTEFWLGPNGVLWNLAHRKIRPVGSLQGFADFIPDYHYFTYTQIDDHDVRDVLVGQYLVARVDVGSPDATRSDYRIVPSVPGQPLQPERRAGMMTAAWPLFYNTMFTALPRGTAAQAYRAFLGLDIAKSQGLFPVAAEPVDYDEAGVTSPTCAACHSTLDPLSYPFATYNGLQSGGGVGFFQYDPDRIDKYFAARYPQMVDMPEAGVVFGQPVADLLEWAQVAANSDQFHIAAVSDYWKLLMGEEPSVEKPDQFDEFTSLWQQLAQHHSVEQMLHALIETEAYGAP